MGCLGVIFWFWIASMLFHCHPLLGFLVLMFILRPFDDDR